MSHFNKTTAWFQTYTGQAYEIQHPDTRMIKIEDIARSLAFTCRFNGHVREFYSVAQHSIHVAELLPTPLEPWGLLHDSAEAYLGDIVRPLKQLIPEFYALENLGLFIIAQRFNLNYPPPEEIKKADNIMLATEKRDLCETPPREWQPLEHPRDEEIKPWNPHESEIKFLKMFGELWGDEIFAMPVYKGKRSTITSEIVSINSEE